MTTPDGPAREARSLSRWFRRVTLAVLAPMLLVSCSGGEPDVVIYCSLDKVFSESFLAQFEKDTGLNVRARYDVEAVKTVGLVNTLMEERSNPRCDVFWNNELANTVKLAEAGLLDEYRSPAAETIPAGFRDEGGRWTGFAARARILIVNTELVPEGEMPTSMWDLLDPKWKGKCGIAKPLAGTTFTHFSALSIALGDRFEEFLDGIEKNEVHVATGNAHIMRLVSDGKLHWGFTDTDDFNVALTDGKPVRAVYPDQGEGELGTMVIPNSVMKIAGGPNPENAQILIDYILRPETEKILAASRSAQIPLHPGVEKPDSVSSPPADFRPMEVDFVAVGKKLDEMNDLLTERFNR